MPDTPLPIAPRDAGDLRPGLTDADRERIAAILSARFADDVISLDDFEGRVAGVYRASSQAELDALVADLEPPVPVGHPERAVALPDPVPAHDRRFAILASLAHHSMAVVPRRLDVSAIFGNVELDLRDATFGPGASELHLRAVFGNITITLPAGAVVEQRASSVLGSIECLAPPAGAGRSRTPLVRLTGHAVLGAVEIRFAGAGTPPRLDRPRRVP
jgi:hypothetical protein